MEGEPACVGRIVGSTDERRGVRRHPEQLSGQKYSSKTAGLKGRAPGRLRYGLSV